MLAVEKWAQGRSPLIALVATQLANFAREIPEILKYQKKHRLLSHTFQVPDLASWYAMYIHPEQFILPFLEMITQASPYANQLFQIGVALMELPSHLEQFKEQGITSEQLREGHEAWIELLRMSFVDIKEDLDDVPMTPEAQTSFQEYKDNNETSLAFLFIVAFPCWLLYKQFPSALYQKATAGDTDAIIKLLSLDPFMLHDPAIGRQIQQVRIHGKQTRYEEILIAPLKPVKVKLTERRCKDMLAGLISLLAEAFKQPLTSIEIRDLFDAVAQDADQEDVDTSLPDSQEAYTKVIQRNRPDWEPLLRTGQIKVK